MSRREIYVQESTTELATEVLFVTSCKENEIYVTFSREHKDVTFEIFSGDKMLGFKSRLRPEEAREFIQRLYEEVAKL